MSQSFEEKSAEPVQPVRFPCVSCGAGLEFAPGLDALRCPYCGVENHLPAADAGARESALVELDYHAYLTGLAGQQETVQLTFVRCPSCGAETTFDREIISDECAFCGTALVTGGASERLIKPRALLPFAVDEKRALEDFRRWIEGLWFAPNNLKKRARRQEKLAGIYLPHWTYDARTATDWRGQRGEHYWVTQTYVHNGKTHTRQVRHTRWYPVSGRLDHAFDDVLVCASQSLPRKYITSLEPWDLHALVPYEEAYLSGFRAERYNVGLEEGWTLARGRMDGEIEAMIRARIGGDEQRILWKNTRHDDITFKHILLPVWISAYRYGEKVYRFMINARTGEVQGERPWSWIKITLAVLLALIIFAVVAVFLQDA